MGLHDRYMPRRPNVISDTIDDEVVIINMLSGAYYSLDNTGAVVWQGLDAGLTVGEVIEQVQERFDGQTEDMAQAVQRFVDELAEERLMTARPSNGDAPLGSLPPANGRSPFAAPMLQKYDDMQDLIMLDPIHDVDEAGWPARKPDPGAA